MVDGQVVDWRAIERVGLESHVGNETCRDGKMGEWSVNRD